MIAQPPIRPPIQTLLDETEQHVNDLRMLYLAEFQDKTGHAATKEYGR